MVRSGNKTVEYREKKPYWDSRIKGKKEIIFCPGYSLDNCFDLKAEIISVSVIKFIDLPVYAKKLFSGSFNKEFYAIKFKLKEV